MRASLWQRRGPAAPAAEGGRTEGDAPVRLATSQAQVKAQSRNEETDGEMREPEPAPSKESLRAERDRLAERLERLEQMLADPEKGQNAILYYRLRGIWSACHNDLVTLARQFRQKYEAESNRAASGTSDAERQAIASSLRAANAREKQFRGEVERIRFLLHGRDKPFKVGEKQALKRELAEAEERLHEARKRVAELRRDGAVTPPPRPRATLSVATRRAINTLLIALAQHYYLSYREEQVAEMALRAARKPVEDVYFGLANDCLALSRKARELVARSKSEQNRQEAVRRRAQYLHERLQYSDDDSAIPDEKSLRDLPTRIASGDEVFSNFGEMLSVNVLSHDYWDLSRALLP